MSCRLPGKLTDSTLMTALQATPIARQGRGMSTVWNRALRVISGIAMRAAVGESSRVSTREPRAMRQWRASSGVPCSIAASKGLMPPSGANRKLSTQVLSLRVMGSGWVLSFCSSS